MRKAFVIWEVENKLQEKGIGMTKAVLEASRQRLRTSLMTAFATVIGIVTLGSATGAGAAARQSIGTAVMGGMCVATLLSLFIVPILYIVVKTIEKRMRLDVHDRKTSNIGESALVAEYGDTYSNHFHDVHGESINGDRLNHDHLNGNHDTPHNNSNSNHSCPL